MRLSIKKRIIAGVSAGVLAITALVGCISANIFNTEQVEAWGETNGGSQGISGGTSGDWSFELNDSSGVRIYFTKNDIAGGEGNTSLFTHKQVQRLTASNCSGGRAYSYALYEFSGAYGSVINGSNTPKVRATLGDKLVELDKEQIYSNIKKKGFNTSPNFGFSKSFSQLISGSSVDTTSLSEWANTLFGVDDKTQLEKNIELFIKTYVNCIGEATLESAGLPTSLQEYTDGDWSLVIEPLVLCKYVPSQTYYCLSYQDFFFGYGHYDNLSVITKDDDFETVNLYRANSSFWSQSGSGDLGDLIARTVRRLGSFYCNYSSQELKIFLASSPFSETAGFGIFGSTSLLTGGGTSASISRHLTLYSDDLQPKKFVGLANKAASGNNNGKGQTAIISQFGDNAVIAAHRNTDTLEFSAYDVLSYDRDEKVYTVQSKYIDFTEWVRGFGWNPFNQTTVVNPKKKDEDGNYKLYSKRITVASGSTTSNCTSKNKDIIKDAAQGIGYSLDLNHIVGAGSGDTNANNLAGTLAEDYVLIETWAGIAITESKNKDYVTFEDVVNGGIANIDFQVKATGSKVKDSSKSTTSESSYLAVGNNYSVHLYNGDKDTSDALGLVADANGNVKNALSHVANKWAKAMNEDKAVAGGLNSIGVNAAGYYNSVITAKQYQNMWGTSAAVALKFSTVLANKRVSDTENVLTVGTSEGAIVGMTLDFVVPQTEVSSSAYVIKRNSKGEISTEAVTGSDQTYSIYDGSAKYSQSSKAGQACFIVAIPNTKSNSSVTIPNGGADKLADILFKNVKINDVTLETALPYNIWAGEDILKSVLYNSGCIGTFQYIKDEKGNAEADVDGIAVLSVRDDKTSSGNATYSNIVVGAYGDEATNKFVGYSVYYIVDEYVTPPQNATMQIKAYEANYIYPTVLGDTEGTLIKTVSSETFEEYSISKHSSDYKGTVLSYNSSLASSSNCSIFHAKPYTTLTVANDKKVYSLGVFDKESLSPKKFTNGNFVSGFVRTAEKEGDTPQGATLNHVVNLTRRALGEEYSASSISKQDDALDTTYVQNVLGFDITNKGKLDDTLKDKTGEFDFKEGSDKLFWSCNKFYVIYNANGEPYSVSPFLNGESKERAGYNVTEKSVRYSPQVKTVGKAKSCMVDGSLQECDNPVTSSSAKYRSMLIESYDSDVLNFYPEFELVAYKPVLDGSTTVDTGIDKVNSYKITMIGDRVRKCNPAGVYSLRVVKANTCKGTLKSDTIATGTDASKLSKSMGNLSVIYAGGNVNLSVESDFELNASGFILDLVDSGLDGVSGATAGYALMSPVGTGAEYSSVVADDSNLKADWGNKDGENNKYDAEAHYQEWLDSIKKNLAVDITCTTYEVTGSTEKAKKEWTGFKETFKVTGGKLTQSDKKSFALSYKNGKVVDDDVYKALIAAISTEYFGDTTSEHIAEAKTLFEKSDIHKTILSAIESNNDANNKSSKSELFGDAEHWYDEQVRTFVIRYLKCDSIKLSKISISDKIDIGAGPKQSGTSSQLFQNGYKAKWAMTVYIKSVEGIPSMKGLDVFNAEQTSSDARNKSLTKAVEAGTVLVAKQHINKADFIISDATTSDARH